MNLSHFIFNTEQLNRIFPYYILINNELGIDAYGAAYGNIIKDIAYKKALTVCLPLAEKHR